MFKYIKSFFKSKKEKIAELEISNEALLNKKLQIFTTNENGKIIPRQIVDYKEAEKELRNYLNIKNLPKEENIKHKDSHEDFVFAFQDIDGYYMQFIKTQKADSLLLDFVGIETKKLFIEINDENYGVEYWVEVLKKFWSLESLKSF